MTISGYGGSVNGTDGVISWSISEAPFALNELKTMSGLEQASSPGGLTTINVVTTTALASIGECSGIALTLSAGGSCGSATTINVASCVCTGSAAEVSADGFLQYTYDFSTASTVS